jgi:UDP-glucose 4-epimerase
MKKILVTGGLGFIGSHTVVALQNQGYEVVIIDNLSNTTTAVLEGIKMITGVLPYFEKIDLRDKVALSSFLQSNTDIDGIIHFAASKAVGESVLQPLHYYENNINALVNLLLEVSQLNKPIEFIFSSSCTVYGQADIMPIKEDSPVKIPESPYGNTKQIGEEILKDLSIVNENIHIILLRYFNPIGAHPSLEIGELPLGKPQNLVPFITQTAAGLHDKLTVFGDDYPTLDGTCVRDYIDVVDLATAHVAALNRLLKNQNDSNFEMYNLGSGKGSSVLEVIKSFEKVAEISLNYEIGSRRSGDVISAFADTSLANQKLGWKTKVSLDESVLNAWNWEKKIRGIK